LYIGIIAAQPGFPAFSNTFHNPAKIKIMSPSVTNNSILVLLAPCIETDELNADRISQ